MLLLPSLTLTSIIAAVSQVLVVDGGSAAFGGAVKTSEFRFGLVIGYDLAYKFANELSALSLTVSNFRFALGCLDSVAVFDAEAAVAAATKDEGA